MRSNTFRFLAVPHILRSDVEALIVHEFRGTEGTTINVFPSGIPGIVFHHNHGQAAIESIVTQSGRTFSPPTLFLHGAGTEPSIMKFGKGSYTVMQMILKPYAVRTLFGLNALRLNEGAVELNDLSNENLNQQLLEAGSDQKRAALLALFLAKNLERQKTRDILVEESLRLIHRGAGRVTVKALLEHLGISERQFERRFCQAVGMSPLSYIRVRRFNEAMRLMKSGRYDTLTEIAHTLNFHDQSHFIRDFKSFTDSTPQSLLQKATDIYYSQAGFSYT